MVIRWKAHCVQHEKTVANKGPILQTLPMGVIYRYYLNLPSQ